MSSRIQESPANRLEVIVPVTVVVLIIVLLCVVFWYIRRCRRRPRYDYSALEDEALLNDRLEMYRTLHGDVTRNMAAINCQYYLRESQRYVFILHLPSMGNRLGKHWFLVRDTATKTERLLTMTSVAENCQVRYNSATRPVLLELLLALQHPYIYPVLDIDRTVISEREYVISVTPFNENGSLKDLIHHSQCQEDWCKKYRNQGCGLPQSHIQRLGRQILEALIFLKVQRFPPFVHLHSGNVILQNGVARLCGLENVLLGYGSQFSSYIPKKILGNKEMVEIICFGHLLFEMASGKELHTFHPSEKNYCDLEHYPQVVDVLKFIFEQGKYRYPVLREVAALDFFRHIDLRELQSHVQRVFRGKVSHKAEGLLKEIRQRHRPKKKNKRSRSMSTIETASVESRDSSGSSRAGTKKKKKQRTLSSSETTPDQLCTQMQTLPLSDIEGSTSVSVPCDGNGRESRAEERQLSRHELLLQEIRSGFQLRRSNLDHVIV